MCANPEFDFSRALAQLILVRSSSPAAQRKCPTGARRHDGTRLDAGVPASDRYLGAERLWQVAQPFISVPTPRWQDGGKRRAHHRAVLAAIVYLVQAGCSWRKL